jgi:hypothetical protein
VASQRLADGKVNCFLSTYRAGLSSKTLAVGDIRPNGQLPADRTNANISAKSRYRRPIRRRPRGCVTSSAPWLASKPSATASLPTCSQNKPGACCNAKASRGGTVITPPPDPGKGWLFGYPLPAGTGGTCGTFGMGNPLRHPRQQQPLH